ncbi:hypothetical protein PSA01_61650 [Pseudonocardia saturnea]|uniref:L,D-TPase catalytic domain-containing protein n=1 Tax=Pseudonocardia saturnea TaxID=33909 RepID=A0ABQ0S888_9PSEU|nr:L,D-transpeptidase [Pseudonocardia autotrophica]BBG00995.1 hypothetical protein Pdca_22040 [Pseudonocardia autotrophica]GEC29136.1 hypothetical protein PSA01_61650 [Pseudonocardia saturnea]
MAVLAGTVVLAGVATAGVAMAGAEAESSDVARQVHTEKQVAGTPCSVSARACVDLESQQAWLITNGEITRGPVPIASGGAGQETPIGHSFRVYRKEADHRSGEFEAPGGGPAPMPWSVFFADGGIAFHGGDRDRASAGCVKLDTAQARAFFDDLQVGDKVQVLDAATERAEREKLAAV